MGAVLVSWVPVFSRAREELCLVAYFFLDRKLGLECVGHFIRGVHAPDYRQGMIKWDEVPTTFATTMLIAALSGDSFQVQTL